MNEKLRVKKIRARCLLNSYGPWGNFKVRKVSCVADTCMTFTKHISDSSMSDLKKPITYVSKLCRSKLSTTKIYKIMCQTS